MWADRWSGYLLHILPKLSFPIETESPGTFIVSNSFDTIKNGLEIDVYSQIWLFNSRFELVQPCLSLTGTSEDNKTGYLLHCFTNTILLLLYTSTSFQVASLTPPHHTVWLNGNAISSGLCFGPLHRTGMQWKSECSWGQTWSEVNEKCSPRADTRCKRIHFIRSSVAQWLSQSLLTSLHKNKR